ncbi:MAG: NADH:ubiquinone reductase (Na(+)-transporting) subunit B [Desulfosalsimonadaceae bacterium]
MGRIEKPFRKLFDRARPYFEKGGRMARLKPFFEATETFFLFPAIPVKNNPFIRDSLDLKRYMSIVLAALMPPFLFGIYNTGYHARNASGLSTDFLSVFGEGLIIVLPIVIVSYGVGLFWEGLFAVIRRHPVSEGFLVTGLLFPLTLPPTIPLWQVAAGITFGVVIGKEVFGGTGRNLFNPALTARAFIFFAYPVQMSGERVWIAFRETAGNAVDAVSGATPLAVAALAEPKARIEAVFADSGYTFQTLFFGNHIGSIGETSAFFILIGALILLATGIASYRIMVGGVIGVLATGLLFNYFAAPDLPAWFSINPLYHLVTGGFAFGIVYMATDPVTAPGTDTSKWIYGFLIGGVAVLIRVVNPAFPEGVMLAILFMNIFSPLMEYAETRLRIRRRIPNV